jgi:histidinol-phosphate/aromatic aminotransferase/cobyric acid decarboxylase-like protein
MARGHASSPVGVADKSIECKLKTSSSAGRRRSKGAQLVTLEFNCSPLPPPATAAALAARSMDTAAMYVAVSPLLKVSAIALKKRYE